MKVTMNARVVQLADGVTLEVLGAGSKVPIKDGVEPKPIVKMGWLLKIDKALMEKHGSADAVLKSAGQLDNPELDYRRMNPAKGRLVLWQDERTGQYCSLFALEHDADHKVGGTWFSIVTERGRDGTTQRNVRLTETEKKLARQESPPGYM